MSCFLSPTIGVWRCVAWAFSAARVTAPTTPRGLHGRAAAIWTCVRAALASFWALPPVSPQADPIITPTRSNPIVTRPMSTFTTGRQALLVDGSQRY